MAKDCISIQELYDVMEMINYEMCVRNNDKIIIFNEI